MNLIPNIDLSNLAPVIALAAIAIVIGAILLLHGILRSRIALLIAVVIGVIAAGPVLGGILVSIINSLAVVLIVCAGAILAALLIVRSHPDLMILVRNALDLLPRRSAISTPTAAPGSEQALTVIDQSSAPQMTPRQSIRRSITIDGDRWGF